MEALTKGEILRLVNNYLGGTGGYLADFSYRSHAEFYPEYCDFDVNPAEYGDTTRGRFISILERSGPKQQAQILRGVIRRFPPGSAPIRTPQQVAAVEELIRRLEAGCGVAAAMPCVTSEVVTRAINDAEALLRTRGATSGVDRMHTAFHGFLRSVCDEAKIKYGSDPTITMLYKLIRENHSGLKDIGPHGDQVDRILRSFASAVDALNTLRNHASVAHPNVNLLGREESYLYVNSVRTLMAYVDARVSTPPSAP
jgi:hypothetical protein